MKRFLILFVVTFMALSVSVMAEQSTLIDFSKLTADYTSSTPPQNTATMIDFSNQAGASFTQVDKAAMRTSLAISNWDIELASSSRNVMNLTESLVKPATVRQGAANYAGDTVMGIRVHFPTEPYNSWAMIKPPFDIPAYSDKTTVDNNGNLTVPQDQVGVGDKFDGFGVVKNVGSLKSLSVSVMGLNYPERLGVILSDENNDQQEIDLGPLNFDGWRTLTWENPNYIADVRNRALRVQPLYPNLTPYRKLVGFIIYRDGSQIGGDFISYLKDVNIVYDLATLNLQTDINNEQVWGILQQREQARRQAELQKLGNIQVLRYLEQQKMAKPAAPGSQGGQSSGGTTGGTGQ
jgi:hypothetical protein